MHLTLFYDNMIIVGQNPSKPDTESSYNLEETVENSERENARDNFKLIFFFVSQAHN